MNLESGGRPGVEPCPPALQASALPRELVGLNLLAEGGGIEPLGRNAYHGFQDRLPAIRRHPLYLWMVLLPGSAPRSSAYQAGALLLSYRR